MKFLVVLQCVVAVALARPQGYSYGLPKFSGDASLVGTGSGGNFAALGGTGSATSFSTGPQFGQYQRDYHRDYTNYAPEVQKHIYVHVPPPEHEVLPAPRVVTYDRPQKHYKIIFIKAPSPPAYQPPVLPQPLQDEEKTVVYVLVKKPEEQPDIVVPTPPPTVPSKPEVYFIKYNTHKTGSDVRSQSIAAPSAPSLNTHASGSGSASSFGGLQQSSGGSQQATSNLGGATTGAAQVVRPHTQYGVPF
ncbi:uncharacterized protein LOC132257988 [Phlebotomus argentipes]|uniref:uncharacterized protein LOC132257988 n=1 Tax=Phlebotomus argentipes TaxID=94469 RepID=UPI002892AFD3|nr:uncharacterized protein LOC132257988 [Phlebotomus argentipes]